MTDRLQLTRNCQFYKIKTKMSGLYIKSILDAAVDNMCKDGDFILNILRKKMDIEVDKRTVSCKVSVRVYPSEKKVYFFNDEIEDKIHAFIVIIEYGSYIGVVKKSCSNITSVTEQRLSLVDSSQLGATIDTNEVEFQKLTLRNITVSDKAMRTRSYEAADLKGLLSPHAAGRSIPSAIKYRDGSSIRSISGVGRFVEASPRSSLEDITKWVVSCIDSISASQFADNYLNTFAKKIALPDVLSSCVPIAILIEVNSLLDKIDSDDCVIKYTPRYGEAIKVSERVCQRLIYGLEKVHEVVGSQYKVNGECDNTYLRVNSNTITLRSNLLSRFKVTNNEDEYTLQRFIVKYGFYSVAFSDPKYMYFMGKCFEDTSGVSDIQGILDILTPKTELLKVNSEKGDFSSSSTSFSSKSMFKAVEEIHSNDDFIFCDDLGIEWADHITINQNEACINFIHSKHGDISTSASKLHDVVGQGIKNLGYVYSSVEAISERANKKFAGNYNTNKQSTNISRVRKGVMSNLDSSLETLFKNYALHRKCVLSCSFISKSLIEEEFKKIASGTKVKGHVIQLLWILSSFIHASKEANVIPVVYCLP
ncbi:hypothetical protein [Cobetia marina]|uniref:hypothetical protein n=1 Tax=Cobetia marina TaxID=28258 RepID=UPI00254959AE|nr:hypothetical protein [Cobetia pacifica]MDI6003655.1 hypothetical protein [Cobetia pacifica]